MTPVSDSEVSGLSYERALAELESLISRLEAGDVELEEAIACYERGSRLAQHCAALLDRTEQKVTQLVVGGPGGLSEKPLPTGGTAGAERGSPAGAAEAPEAVPSTGSPPGRRSVPESVPRARPVERRPRDTLPVDPDDIPF